MSGIQKIIKYLAIAFALALAVGIISSLMIGIVSVGNIFYDRDITIENLEKLDVSGDVAVLNVELLTSNLTIKKGDFFVAETNSKNINVKQDKNKLFIKEKDNNWFENQESDLVVYVPDDLMLDAVVITTGTGKTTIDKLNTQELYLELGVGKAEINNLEATNKAEIKGGVGEIVLLNGNISNLNFDVGVGTATINTALLGNNKIDSGIGKLILNLIGTQNDYKIKANNGIGNSTLNGSGMSDDTYYGEGNTLVEIDGGIGSTKINFIEQ